VKALVFAMFIPFSAIAATQDDPGAIDSAHAYVDACRSVINPPDEVLSEIKNEKISEEEIAILAMAQMFCDGVASSVARTVAAESVYRYGQKRICVAPDLTTPTLVKAMFETWDKSGDEQMTAADLALEALSGLSNCLAVDEARRNQ
jgi:hypothetical protein